MFNKIFAPDEATNLEGQASERPGVGDKNKVTGKESNLQPLCQVRYKMCDLHIALEDTGNRPWNSLRAAKTSD